MSQFKETLIKRIAELDIAVQQCMADANVRRGQKSEAESMLQHLLREEQAAVLPGETPPPSEH